MVLRKRPSTSHAEGIESRYAGLRFPHQADKPGHYVCALPEVVVLLGVITWFGKVPNIEHTETHHVSKRSLLGTLPND